MEDSSHLEHSHGQQFPGAGYPGEGTFHSPAVELPSGGLLEYWRILQRRKATIIIVALIGMCIAFLYTVPQTPIYQARTVIEIQTLNEDFLNIKDVDPNSNSAGFDPTVELQTQVHILESDSLLQRVSRKIAAQSKTLNPPATRLSAWRKILHLPEKTASSAQNAAASVSNLRIHTEPSTRLIEILCDSPDPNFAALYANTLTSEFIQQGRQARWDATQSTGEFLANQMQDLKVRMERSEDAMQAYATDNHLVITDERTNADDTQLAQLQQQLSAARAERIQRQSRYELARTAPVDSLGEVLDDGGLKATQANLTDLRRQYAELASVLNPANEKLQKLSKPRSSHCNRPCSSRETTLWPEFAMTTKLLRGAKICLPRTTMTRPKWSAPKPTR